MPRPANMKSDTGVKVQEAADVGSSSQLSSPEVMRSGAVGSAEPPARLVAKNLTVYFHHRLVLEQVTLRIAANCVTSIIGPTGTGKSTLLRCFNRTNDLIDGVRVLGDVLLDGQDIRDPGLDVGELRKRVAHVVQRSTIFPISIFDNVAFGPRVAGVVGSSELRQPSKKG